MTREQFWSSPLGIIFIGLIVGVVVVLLIRACWGLRNSSRRRVPKYVPPPKGVPRAESTTFREK